MAQAQKVRFLAQDWVEVQGLRSKLIKARKLIASPFKRWEPEEFGHLADGTGRWKAEIKAAMLRAVEAARPEVVEDAEA